MGIDYEIFFTGKTWTMDCIPMWKNLRNMLNEFIEVLKNKCFMFSFMCGSMIWIIHYDHSYLHSVPLVSLGIFQYVSLTTSWPCLFYWLFYLFTYQMLSPFPASPPQICYPFPPVPASIRLLPNSHDHSCLIPMHSLLLGHWAFTGPWASLAIDSR